MSQDNQKDNQARIKAAPRAIALVGPHGGGKTSLLESIAAMTGAVPRKGSVTGGYSLGDSAPESNDRNSKPRTISEKRQRDQQGFMILVRKCLRWKEREFASSPGYCRKLPHSVQVAGRIDCCDGNDVDLLWLDL